jgi:hypothetical protein
MSSSPKQDVFSEAKGPLEKERDVNATPRMTVWGEKGEEKYKNRKQ